MDSRVAPNRWDRVTWLIAFGVVNLAVMGVVAVRAHSEFVLDACTWIVVLLALHPFRRKLFFSFTGCVLCMVEILMNMAGVFGAYNLKPLGLGWDKWLHLIAPAGLALIFFEYLWRKNLGLAEVVIVSFLAVNGLGAIEEDVEFTGTHFFGVKQGMYGVENGLNPSASTFDRFDTQWDLIFDSAGAAIPLGILSIARARRR